MIQSLWPQNYYDALNFANILPQISNKKFAYVESLTQNKANWCILYMQKFQVKTSIRLVAFKLWLTNYYITGCF